LRTAAVSSNVILFFLPSCVTGKSAAMNKSSLAHLAFLNLDRLLRWTFKVRQVLFTEPGNYKIPSGLAGRLTGFLFDSKLQKEYTGCACAKRYPSLQIPL
jgi:hypothetical protein